MTTQDKPAVGPLSAGDLVQHVVAKNMFRVIRRIDGEWPDVWLNMVGEPRQAHMADRWVFVGRPGPDGWIPWSGGKNPVPGQRVEVKIRWRNGRPSEGAVASDVMRWSHGTRRSGGGDIIAFRLAPTAPVEAGGSERENRTTQEWADRCVAKRVAGDLLAKANRTAAKDPMRSETVAGLREDAEALMRLASRHQPSGETREAVDADALRELTRAAEECVRLGNSTGEDTPENRMRCRARSHLMKLTTPKAILALIRPAAPDGGGDALADIAAERRRQIEVEDWTPERDDRHDDYSLGLAAAAYAGGVDCGSKVVTYTDDVSGGRGDAPIWGTRNKRVPVPWPASWHPRWWKPTGDRRRDLVKAGALIVAEIERLDRAAIPASEGG